MSSDPSNNIILKREGISLVFDRQIKTTRDGLVSGVEILPVNVEMLHVAAAGVLRKLTKDINNMHQELGHPGEAMTCATGEAMGFWIIGKLDPCAECAFLGNARQKKLNKVKVERSLIVGERLFLDVSSPKYRSLG